MYPPYIEPKSMFFHDSLPAHRTAQPTNEELQRQMTRIETRLVKLMHHMGIDTHGNPL